MPAPFGLLGKFYWEINVVNDASIQIGMSRIDNYDPAAGNYGNLSGITITKTGNIYNFGTATTGGIFKYGTGDVVAIAYDSDTDEVTFTKNGSEATTVTLNQKHLMVPLHVGDAKGEAVFNFGQQPFLYTPPAGFEALQTQNLPTPEILDGRDHFQAITGSGSGAAAGAPGPNQRGGDFARFLTADGSTAAGQGPEAAFDGIYQVGTKNGSFKTTTAGRTATFAPVPDITFDNTLRVLITNSPLDIDFNGVNVVRTATSQQWNTVVASGGGTIGVSNPLVVRNKGAIDESGAVMFSAIEVDGEVLVDVGILPLAQSTFPNGLWWIKDRANSNQHQLVDSVRGGNLALTCPTVGPQAAYVAPSGSSVAWCWNFDNANPARNGFEIIQYAGNGTSQTVNHRLGKKPEFIITQPIDGSAADTPSISCWHIGFGNDQHFIRLNTADPVATGNTEMWNNIGATSYDVGSDPKVNLNSATIQAYLWTSIPGYSSFGSYQGNGSEDGPFIYTGHSVAFVMVKRATGTGNWQIMDTTINPTNPANIWLEANEVGGEQTGNTYIQEDFLSNGFKPRGGASTQDNLNGETYVYAAFASCPFQSPATAR